jgi:hypothetical protein
MVAGIILTPAYRVDVGLAVLLLGIAFAAAGTILSHGKSVFRVIADSIKHKEEPRQEARPRGNK